MQLTFCGLKMSADIIDLKCNTRIIFLLLHLFSEIGDFFFFNLSSNVKSISGFFGLNHLVFVDLLVQMIRARIKLALILVT